MNTLSRLGGAAVAALLLSACASRPPEGVRPDAEIRTATSAIAAAESAGAAQHVGAELRIARIKLTDAQRAAEEGQMELARRSAEQAKADADLAAARTREARARAEYEKLKVTP